MGRAESRASIMRVVRARESAKVPNRRNVPLDSATRILRAPQPD